MAATVTTGRSDPKRRRRDGASDSVDDPPLAIVDHFSRKVHVAEPRGKFGDALGAVIHLDVSDYRFNIALAVCRRKNHANLADYTRLDQFKWRGWQWARHSAQRAAIVGLPAYARRLAACADSEAG